MLFCYVNYFGIISHNEYPLTMLRNPISSIYNCKIPCVLQLIERISYYFKGLALIMPH